LPAETQSGLRSEVRSTSEADLPIEGNIESVAFLGSRFGLVVVGSSGLAEDESIRARLVCDGSDWPIACVRLGCWRSIEADAVLLLLSPAVDGSPLPRTGTCVIESDDRVGALTPADFGTEAMAVEQFAARHLLPLNQAARAAVFDELFELTAAREPLGDAATNLSVLRDLLRHRHPEAEVHPQAELTAQIDGIWRVDPHSVYVEGWLCDRRSRLERLQLITPEGRTIDIIDRLSRYRRPDVNELLGLSRHDETGFIVFVELPEESSLGTGWLLQGLSVDGLRFETATPPVVEDPVSARTVIVDDIQLEGRQRRRLLTDHIAPAVDRVQRRLAERVEIDFVDQHGTPPISPTVSIVIPLYRRTELLEQQLSQFVLDPELGEADLIYVLDSPEDTTRLRPFAVQLFDLYKVPFRLVTLTGNGGYSVVNNLGAALARGRLLLLMNSDVFPEKPGWMSRMVEFYDSDPKIGALAPKLLYEDGSIQHAGLYFDRAPGSSTWSNEHYYKGLHRRFPAANVARPVPAVTGACLMISTERYLSIGGLRGMFVRGDYEDSDLCLRLRERGLESWYLPEVELYHLEGQSYPSDEREAASQFNRLLHSDAWRESLLALEGWDK
jgi:GT2 family glycosyltransferase